MSASQAMRRSIARNISKSSLLRRVFLRFALDESLLVNLLEDPIFVHRVVNVPPVAGRLSNVLAHPRVFDKLILSNRMGDQLLDNDEFMERLLGNRALLLSALTHDDMPRMALQSPEFLAALAATDGFREWALGPGQERLLEIRLSSPVALGHILRAPATAELAATQAEFLSRVAATDGFADWAKHGGRETLLNILLNHGESVDAIVSDPSIAAKLRKLALQNLRTDAEAVATVAADAAFVRKLLAADAAFKTALEDSNFVARAAIDDRVHKRIVVDAAALNKLLAHPRSRDAILADVRVLDAILNDERTLSQILLNKRLLHRVISRGDALDALLSDPRTLQTLLGDTRAVDSIAAQPDLFARIASRAPAIRAIASNDGLLTRIVESPGTAERLMENAAFRKRAQSNHSFIETTVTADRVAPALAKRVRALAEFDSTWSKFAPLATERPGLADSIAAARAALSDPAGVPDAIMGLLCDGERLILPGATLEFPDRRSLWVVLHEILIEEEYFFESRAAAPRILDCGSHFGLATYYFKRLFPEARITAFEPLPRLHAMAKRNAESNAYRNVDVLPYALGASDAEVTFHVSDSDSMAGSLTERRRDIGDHLVPITVEGRRLSAYLDEPVHYLKLDIEGSEDVVLEEAAPKLGNVQHLFCEYHHGAGLSPDRLPKILALIESAGFDMQAGKSYAYHESTRIRPMRYVDKPYSLILWARNRHWT